MAPSLPLLVLLLHYAAIVLAAPSSNLPSLDIFPSDSSANGAGFIGLLNAR